MTLPRRAALILCTLVLCANTAAAQEYYGVPIEDGGVAFLLDVSGSMDNRGEPLKAATESALRGLAGVLQGTAAGQSTLGQAIINRAANIDSTPQPPKMDAARQELLRALDSLRDGTNFTIITFGDRAVEWPGGVRITDSDTRSLARQYVEGLSAAGGTPMADALQLGFASPGVRTLFLVSDGRPNPSDILGLVKHLQRTREGRRMVINTVGIGKDQDTGLLCRLALANEGIYVRDGAVACTFSPCDAGDGIVTFYRPESMKKRPSVTRICSTKESPGCTPKTVYDTMLSEARFQTTGRTRTKVTNCLDIEVPDPVTIVLDKDGLEATTYTRPGHPTHPSKIRRIVKQQGDDVVVETTGAGDLPLKELAKVDEDLIGAVRGKLSIMKPADDPAGDAWQKHLAGTKKRP